ncbi:serine hydrolase domain-containing protein [Niastella sp. OAS944]|uniref:serine hydrolase domain-containing protein n=1 Tax=Niastella sp. OAS944 TaxID=2664089 RepID=UPI00349162B8|nr:CubicO group peptidase (beta-lactamase class C family) [Chitinophagaceae bacterium OAS944]
MKQIVIVIAALLYFTTAFAQSTHPVLSIASTPEAGGFSSKRLSRIDTALKEYVDKGRMNGAVAMIVHDGKIVYYKNFGYNDQEAKTPMPKDGIFRIASQTKAITSVAVMMLFEEGKFMLDDPISNFIPEFRNPKVLDKYNKADTTYTTVPAKREITIRDLLTHTSGLGYAQIGTTEAKNIYYKAGVIGGIGVPDFVLADKMKILGGLPLFHQPGEKWTYGLNDDVLGYLIEVVSGMSLKDFLTKRIFEPLGMKDTYFYLPADKKNRLVMLYTEDSATKKLVKMPEKLNLYADMYRDYPKMNGTYYSGGAGLSSTVYDYAIFLQMLLNGGEYNGKRILSHNSVRMMTMNQIGDISRGANKFGLGFGITTERGSALLPTQEGTYEWGGMFATTYWVDPKEKLIGLVYRNIWPTSWGSLGNLYKVLVYQAMNY